MTISGAAEDRLSNLPVEIIHRILSLLPSTKNVAQTSLISRRWRHLWAHHTNLHFKMPYGNNDIPSDEMDAISRSYVIAVDRCLSSYDPPSIDSFEIDLWLPTSLPHAESKANAKVADRWIRFAVLRSARRLSVEARTQFGGWYGRIPCSIFSCRSVADLFFSFSAFPDVPSNFSGFKNLTKLVISCGSISNKAVADLLGGCPLLEELQLIGCFGITFVDISARCSPRLKNLLLMSYYHDEKWMGARIEAPNLRSIQFKGSLSTLDWEGSPVLNEADLSSKSDDGFESFDDWIKIVSAVSNVGLLKVNHWFYQFEIPMNYFRQPLLKNLKELHCDIDWITGSVLRSLTYGLGQCPLLEKFIISLNRNDRLSVKDSVQEDNNEDPEDEGHSYIIPPYRHKVALIKHVEDEHEHDGWNPSEHLGELDYYLHHLKTITMKCFLGSKNEMMLLKFLFGKAICLEQFVISDLLWREEWELQKVFATVHLASPQVDMRLSTFDNMTDARLWRTLV